jgi:hypothetical protein
MRPIPIFPFRCEASSHINYLELFAVYLSIRLWGDYFSRVLFTVVHGQYGRKRDAYKNDWSTSFHPTSKRDLYYDTQEEYSISRILLTPSRTT